MKCKKPWNDKFIVKNLNRSFCEKEYKNHRKNLLLEREISKLPETMNAAEKQKKIDIQVKISKEIREKILKINNELRKLKLESVACHNTIHNIRNGTDKSNTSEKRKFIMACPNNNCRGYLSSQYKCDLCELFTCPHCLEIIGYNKNDIHTCNPDNIASAEFIKKDTKPCPQCGVRIHKISGCNQMWCTECKIAFDYNTLKIDNGVVHNPHYYQHLAQQNNGQAPRNPQDVLCGGLCSVRDLHNTIYSKLKIYILDPSELQSRYIYISNMHRTISHITNYELPNARRQVRNLLDTEELRVSYILGKKDDKDFDKQQFSTLIYKRDIQRKKFNELLHIYELLSVVGIENFNLFKTYTSNDYYTMMNNKNKEFDNLRIYCNEEFSKISIAYNHKAIFIDDCWGLLFKKYKINNL
tara:strand:- start:5180 stop:6415 length:1236 start_codon:yes stop_codon:yes gene_type:complete